MNGLDPSWRVGHVPDEVDGTEERYADHPELSGAAPIPTDDVDLRGDLTEVRSQLDQNCCAHATTDAVVQAAKASGEPLPFFPDRPSVQQFYTLARLRGRPRQPLIDTGSSLKDMFEGISNQGMIGERTWPEDPEEFNRLFGPPTLEANDVANAVPPDDLWREGEGVTITASHMVTDGASSSVELRAALRRRRTPTLCMLVDERYANIGKDVYSTPGGRVLGSHCQLIVGYSRTLQAFLLRNSWGLAFGDLGYAWVDEGLVDRMSYGKWVVDLGFARKRTV